MQRLGVLLCVLMILVICLPAWTAPPGKAGQTTPPGAGVAGSTPAVQPAATATHYSAFILPAICVVIAVVAIIVALAMKKKKPA